MRICFVNILTVGVNFSVGKSHVDRSLPQFKDETCNLDAGQYLLDFFSFMRERAANAPLPVFDEKSPTLF